jgi:hypothetical protein
MATISSRVYSSGVLTANGTFDEVTYNPNAGSNAVTNLISYSQDFTNTNFWTAGTGTLTPNTVVAPDGTLTASTFTATGTFSGLLPNPIALPSPSVGQVVTFSVYVKNGNITPGGPNQYFTLVNETNSATGINAHVQTWDLATGTPITPSNLISSSITPVGNGWYRCSITFTYSNTAYQFRPKTWIGSYTGTNFATSYVYLWGAQVEYGSVLTPYQPKVASTNLVNYSTNLTNASYWIPQNSTITANSAIAPDGTLTAAKLTGNNGATTRKTIYQPISGLVTNSTYTLSTYIKSAGYTSATIWMDTTLVGPNQYQGSQVLVSLINGLKTTADASIVNVIPLDNDWYRLSTTGRVTGTSFNLELAMGEANGSGTPTGDGVSGIYIWGTQLELADTKVGPYNSIPTTYKPTTLNTNIVLPRFVKRDSANTYFIRGEYDEVTYNANSTNALYNIHPYSEDWTKNIQSQQNSTIASANTVAPDGSLTGTRITSTITGGTNTALIQKLVAIPTTKLSNNLPWCWSVFVKQGTAPSITISAGFVNATTYKDILVKLTWSSLALSIGGSSNIQVGGPSNYGVEYAGGGWYRLWCTLTNTYNGTQIGPRIYVRDSGSSNVLGEYNYIWGGQLEQASYPSPYQPTISTSTSPTESVSSPSVLATPKFANRITNVGNSYVKKEYDEWTGVPITDGLILYADAAVSSSYTPSSGTWYNLANNSTNGIVTAVTNGSGSIGSETLTTNDFDYDYSTMSLKINDNRVSKNCQIRFENIDYNGLAASNNFTVMFAAKKDYHGLSGNLNGNSELFQAVHQGYNSGWRIAEASQGTPGAPFIVPHYWGIEMSPAATPSGWAHYVSDSSSNRWCIVALSISPTNVYAFCNNNITTRINPGTYYGGASPTNRGWINFTGAGAGSFNGRLGFFMVYNRALSITEMTYNFNQFKRRYGL